MPRRFAEMSTRIDGCYCDRVSANENLAFDALSDRVRRRILSVLGERGELTVTEIAESVGVVGRSTVSSHLRILRTSGVVTERRDGRRRLYSLDTEGSVRDALRYLQALLHGGVQLDTASQKDADSTGKSERSAG
jgi:ArsR family transcriptional regulator, arsenate/arsenite/antimonite-responsive transcriptional repressor